MGSRSLETAYDPFEHAARLGIPIEYQRLRTANALWIAEHRVIVVRTGLRRVDERSALTHELGHVCLGHQDMRPRFELQADRWAVRKLIPNSHLEQAALFSDDPAQWCHELGVSADLLERAMLDYRAA